MLSRKMLRHLQVARGLSFAELTARTGIAPQAIFALLNEQEKDPSKLISQSTLRRIFNLLGVGETNQGLKTTGVVEWKCPAKDRGNWFTALQSLRKELFGAVDVAIVFKQTSLFQRKAAFMLVHDATRQHRVAITGIDTKAIRELKGLFAAENAREVTIRSADFEQSLHQLDHGVYRITQFNVVVGGKAVKYTWDDVQVAAKEFNFTTDQLIDLIVTTVTAVPAKQEDSMILANGNLSSVLASFPSRAAG